MVFIIYESQAFFDLKYRWKITRELQGKLIKVRETIVEMITPGSPIRCISIIFKIKFTIDEIRGIKRVSHQKPNASLYIQLTSPILLMKK